MRVDIESCSNIEALRKEARRLNTVAESQGDTLHALRKENQRMSDIIKFLDIDKFKSVKEENEALRKRYAELVEALERIEDNECYCRKRPEVCVCPSNIAEAALKAAKEGK